MKRAGWLVVVVALMAATACRGSSGGGSGGLGGTSTTAKAADACAGKTLQATEVGITPTTIAVTVMADVGSLLAPGLFQTSVDGVRAWAAYTNAHGGLACRRVTVAVADSKLDPQEAKNGVIAACTSSLALVGTTALFLNDMRPAQGCKDRAGVATGIPDLPAAVTEPAEQCSPISFTVTQQGASCPYSGSGVRHYDQLAAEVAWFERNVTPDLHGVFVLSPDLPSTITASTPIFAAMQRDGVKQDREFGVSALATQSSYTPVTQAIKASKSNFAMIAQQFSAVAKMRKEAVAQGADSVKVWACELACYTPDFITQGGSAVEGQYAWLQFLPFEDKGSNAMLDTLLQYDKKPDAFAIEAFASGLLLAHAIDGIVAAHGPNALTRAAIIAGLDATHDFDAGGMLPKIDVGGRKASPCIVIVQVQHGAWVQVDPLKKGTFDCTEPNAITPLDLDPLKAYRPQ